jgi:hypothetical protein
MPPAFNLSQDQTLQFDLDFLLSGIEKNSISRIQFHFRERLRSVDLTHLKQHFRTAQSSSGTHPSNAHAYRLYVVKELSC